MKRSNRISAMILTVLILATILFSYGFLAENIHHDCPGEECSICLEIKMAVQTISSYKTLLTLPLIVAVLCVFTQICADAIKSNRTKNTLITLKVELLD